MTCCGFVMNIRPGQLSRRNLRIAFWPLHQKKCPSDIPQMLINIDDMDGLVTTPPFTKLYPVSHRISQQPLIFLEQNHGYPHGFCLKILVIQSNTCIVAVSNPKKNNFSCYNPNFTYKIQQIPKFPVPPPLRAFAPWRKKGPSTGVRPRLRGRGSCGIRLGSVPRSRTNSKNIVGML